MAEPFSVSAHASKQNVEVWARSQDSNTRIDSKVGQDGQTVLYAKKMGRFEALFHRSTKAERVETARSLVESALKTDPPTFKSSIQGGGQRVLSQGKFSELPEKFLQSGPFKRAVADLGMALSGGDKAHLTACGAQLADLISAELRKQPYSSQMRFALADSNTLAKELLSTIVSTTRSYLEKTGGDVLSLPPDRIDALGPRALILMGTVDRVMCNLSDHSVSDKEMVVNGQTYKRDENPLGSGAFGQTYIYRADKKNLKPGDPETLVVKSATDPMNLGFREAKILNPLREARALVNASGTGAADFSGNIGRFHSTVRVMDGSVLVVMRLEEGGSSEGVFKKALNRMGSLDSANKISEKQYEDLTLTLMKDAVQGAIRYREGGQVAHYDLKIDNVLVSKDGQGRVADPGASRGLGNTDPLDSPANLTHFTPISYTAPEKFYGAATTPAADVYSLGMTLLEALGKNGPLSLFKNPQTHPLFTATDTVFNMGTVQKKVMDWGRDPNAVMLNKASLPPGSLLEKYADLINQMTSPQPGKRPTLEQVLAHPLFNQPGQGSDEIRGLIKSLALPKPAVPQPQAPPQQPQPQVVNAPGNLGRRYVGDSQSEDALSVITSSRRSSVSGEELSEEVSLEDSSRSLDESRDDTILAYGRRAPSQRMSGTFEATDAPEEGREEPPTVLDQVSPYVAVARQPRVDGTGVPSTTAPGLVGEGSERTLPSDRPLVRSSGSTDEDSSSRSEDAYNTETSTANRTGAYDHLLEATDGGTPEERREIPGDTTSPLRSDSTTGYGYNA